ncbi:unnamed protein product%2C partial [Xyrichtys novacula]|uniref:Unnamed protein product, partial n=1 Tax=Xyrichtys novacula TaxID=13765 RepID=A0AAV1F3T3_XYRNO|nr:unnamed protein product%2C partial [Xyrichtys novacula]
MGSSSEVSDLSEIRKFAAGSYRNLFKSDWTHNPDVHNNFLAGLPQVSEVDNSRLAAEVWSLLRKERRGQVDSIHWLLQEPVLKGACLDLPSWAGQSLGEKTTDGGDHHSGAGGGADGTLDGRLLWTRCPAGTFINEGHTKTLGALETETHRTRPPAFKLPF